MEFGAEESLIPSTYDPSFHGSLDSNPWIKRMPYRKLGATDLTVSLLSYGGSSLAKFYGYCIPLIDYFLHLRESIGFTLVYK
jgi:hypothetical protein